MTLTDDKILWFEDEPENTTEYSKALQDNFHLCKAIDWSLGPAHTISAGIRYLLESIFGNSEKYPLPNLILLDSQLRNDEQGKVNIEEIQKLHLSNPQLKEDAKNCIHTSTGGAVLDFLGKHIYPHFSSRIKVVYLSQFDENQILTEHGGQILEKFPGLLSGYHSKSDNPNSLISMLFDILQHPNRGHNFEQIRTALNSTDAEYLLGTEGDQYEWSNSYRLALTDLVLAGEDRAWPFENNDQNPYVESSNLEVFPSVLQSHKQLPRALILAERGCGKEGFAKALHNMWYSNYSDSPFISVNIGGVPPWSAGVALQLRLFGGHQDRNQDAGYGCVPQAWNGTLLLDELGDTQKDVQDTLLRLIQEGEYEPALWERQVWAAHCCFIGTSNRDLWDEDSFRTDLADRLGLYVIKIPPLRKMKEDIPFWMTKIARETAVKLRPFTNQNVPHEFEFHDVAANVIQGYSFPGNLRELTHTIRRMQLSSLSRSRIPLGTVVKEISRLRTAENTQELRSFELPNTNEELNRFFTKFAEYARSNANNFSLAVLVRYVNLLCETNFTVYKLKKHFKKIFSIPNDKLGEVLKQLEKSPKDNFWKDFVEEK